MQGHPVLLNRAPTTLHRLGILAFQPVLVEGRATQRLTGKKEGEVHLDSYNGQGAWRPWSFSLTEDDDEDLLNDEDAMSQDEEEVLSSSWSGSCEGGEFPNLREPKEKRVQSTKGSGYQSGSVPRRPQRKRQGGRRGTTGRASLRNDINSAT
ncbi:RNA polymerase beta' subunit [Trifolium repens]|jgi:hypothetical protein|nr:RNA polymerase beta' subunit [Trifolium repens]KAK2351222.1 RNA polymerase beta' subunit [Trifolium repens]